jgi:beta-N-acetylhexosaminidase
MACWPVMRRLGIVLAVVFTFAGCAAGSGGSGTVTTAPGSASAGVPSEVPSAGSPSAGPLGPSSSPRRVTTGGSPTLGQMIGQKLIVRMEGPTPSSDLLGRIGRGEVGGVILFAPNITSAEALAALTERLHGAATAGGQPPLLIAVDQEGGPIKRIRWAPPTMSPPDMGRSGDAPVARSQGESTGAALQELGIDIDFAPVADVPASTNSFMYKAGRTFSFDASTTATLADAFASGLESAGVLPAMKHFPGIGFATRNTDSNVVVIEASLAALDPGLLPYRTSIGHDIPLIMLSNATYSAYDASSAAGWSQTIATTLLRDELGFRGVSITDSLDGTAHARGLSTTTLALRAAVAGTDMLLVTGSESTTGEVYRTLLDNAQNDAIPRATLRASYDRILALKAGR